MFAERKPDWVAEGASLSLSGLSSTHFQHPAQDHPHLLQGLVLLLGVLPGPTSTGSPARGLPQEPWGCPQWGWRRRAGVLEDCTHRGQILHPAGPRPHGTQICEVGIPLPGTPGLSGGRTHNLHPDQGRQSAAERPEQAHRKWLRIKSFP